MTVKVDTIEAKSALANSSMDTFYIQAAEDLVVDFVTRFYELCLGRLPDSAGLNGWVNALLDQSQAGADVALGFVFSQ